MTTEEIKRIVHDAIADAVAALPNATDDELGEWLMTHSTSSLPPEVQEWLRDEGIKAGIREAAQRLGITLADEPEVTA